MEQTTTKHDEQINKLANQIISNSKDTKWAKEMLSQLKGLYQMDKLIDIPLSDIVEVIDFGACVIYKVRDGFVFEAKGGMMTHVSMRMQSICTMLQTLFDLHAKEDKTEDENTIYEAFSTAVLYAFQCPIFASMNEESLYGIATDILRRFNEYATEHYNNAEAPDRTEADYKADAEFEHAEQAVEMLANAPLPPEDKDE